MRYISCFFALLILPACEPPPVLDGSSIEACMESMGEMASPNDTTAFDALTDRMNEPPGFPETCSELDGQTLDEILDR